MELKTKPKDENTTGKKQRFLILLKPTVVKPSTEETSPVPAFDGGYGGGSGFGGGGAKNSPAAENTKSK